MVIYLQEIVQMLHEDYLDYDTAIEVAERFWEILKGFQAAKGQERLDEGYY